jgi:hypothetical protein
LFANGLYIKLTYWMSQKKNKRLNLEDHKETFRYALARCIYLYEDFLLVTLIRIPFIFVRVTVGLWWLTLFTTVVQLYRGSPFNW